MIYKNSNYIYPPRPEKVFPRSGMDVFDNGKFLAQPKFNGDCTEVYTGKDLWKVMNRHKKPLSNHRISRDEIMSIVPNNGNNIIVGEYMNDSKKDENGKVFNNKFVIWDIIVNDNVHLIGKNFQERLDMLYDMFKFIDENDYSYKITNNIYMTKSFYSGFGELWDKFVKIDMLEGLVLKRIMAGLEVGTTEKNNSSSQCKCRKPTKNYTH